jgi:hypothetical protein
MKISAFVALILIGSLGFTQSTAANDSLVLLQAVEQSRRAVASGIAEIEVRVIGKGKTPFDQTNLIRVQFSGDRRSFRFQRNLTFVRHDDKEAYDSLGRDSERAIAAGVAKVEETEIRGCWDGKDYADYWKGRPNAGFRKSDYAKMSLDPRLIGVDPYFVLGYNFSDHIPHAYVSTAESRVANPVNGKSVRGIQLTVKSGQVYDFVVEAVPPYRVHSVHASFTNGSGYEIQNTFGDDDKSPLPSISHVTHFGPMRSVQKQCIIRMLNMDTFTPIATDVGTLGSLDLPINTKILDYRTDKELGYWDGQAISPRKAALPKAAMPPVVAVPAPPAASVGRIVLAVTIVLVALVAAVYVARRRAVA